MTSNCPLCSVLAAQLREAEAKLDALTHVLNDEPFDAPVPREPNDELAHKIIQLVVIEYDIQLSDLHGRDLSAIVTWPRQVAMYLVKRHTRLSYTRVASLFQRQSWTAMHACQAVQNRRDTEPAERARLERLEARIATFLHGAPAPDQSQIANLKSQIP